MSPPHAPQTQSPATPAAIDSVIVDVLQRIMALLDPPPPAPESPAKEMGFHAALKPAGKSAS